MAIGQAFTMLGTAGVAGAGVWGWWRAWARNRRLAPYQELFATHPHPLWIYDLDTLEFLEVNEAACRATGYDRAALLALPAGALARDGSSLVDAEVTTRDVEWHGHRARLIITSDIAAWRAMERSLQASEQRFRQLFERNLAGVFRIAPDGQIIEANDAFARILEFETASALLTDRLHYAFATTSERHTILDQLRQQGILSGVEFQLQRQDGTKAWVLANLALVPGLAGETIEGTIFDITQRKALEEHLRQAQKLEAIGRLSAGVAHDFNNLLTVINGYTDLLLGRPEAEPFHAKIGMIRKAGTRASDLTHQLLAFGRQQVLQPRVLEINAVLGEIGKLLQPVIGEDMNLILALADEPLQVLADRSQLEQLIVNLATNARDAMPTGGNLTIETRAVWLDDAYARTHPGTQQGPYILLAVTDTGAGMDEAARTLLFEPFYTTKARGQGTGLGLATVFGFVQQSGGIINAYSEPGLGTAMKIYLPQVTAASDGPDPVEWSDGDAHGNETILLVEDEENVRGLASEVLRSRGYHVLTAHLPTVAIDLCRATVEPIHLLITDVVMPEMNGRSLARILAPERAEMRVLYMSGYPDHAITRGGELDEGIAFQQKPFTPKALAAKVRTVLDAPRDRFRPH